MKNFTLQLQATGTLAKYILDKQLFIVGMRPPKPPSQKK
jgi:hypothetical protein